VLDKVRPGPAGVVDRNAEDRVHKADSTVHRTGCRGCAEVDADQDVYVGLLVDQLCDPEQAFALHQLPKLFLVFEVLAAGLDVGYSPVGVHERHPSG
jgi:hypothetical protein